MSALLRSLVAAWAAELAGLLPPGLRRLASSLGRARGYAVRLPRGRVLRRTLLLPLAAERNLRDMLAFEMDRYTPFKADAVYFQHAVLARDRARRQLRVELAVAPRDEADRLCEAARREGLAPAALDLDGLRLELRARRRWPARLLAAGCVALVVLAIAVPPWRKLDTLAALESQAAALRGELSAAARAREELKRLAAEEHSLLERRRLRPAAIEVLDELTRALPDSSWLSHVELAGNTLRIRGESPDAAALVKAMAAAKLFRGAALEGSVTRDPGAARERFAIVVTTQAQP